MGMIALFLFLQIGHAQESTLEGLWTRVVDGCEPLPIDEVRRLAESGGSNSVSRSEVLMFHGTQFEAKIYPPDQCAPHYVPDNRFNIAPAQKVCKSGYSRGDFSLINEDQFTIVADAKHGDTPWGTDFRQFAFKQEGDVLYIHPLGHDDACTNGSKHIYFIRTPTS